MVSEQITKDFGLDELLRSSTATRMGFTEQYNPPKEVLKSLEKLCKNVLQPIRDLVRMPIKVSSGYRCERTNKAIGGAKNSQHTTGQAADIQAIGMTNNTLARMIMSSGVRYDQLILELLDRNGEPTWLHISYSDTPRNEILEAYKENGVTKYRKI